MSVSQRKRKYEFMFQSMLLSSDASTGNWIRQQILLPILRRLDLLNDLNFYNDLYFLGRSSIWSEILEVCCHTFDLMILWNESSKYLNYMINLINSNFFLIHDLSGRYLKKKQSFHCEIVRKKCLSTIWKSGFTYIGQKSADLYNATYNKPRDR